MIDLPTNITAPEHQKLSPRAEQILKETLPLAPKDGSLQAKGEFLQMLVAKLQAIKDFERWDPEAMESIVLKRGYKAVAGCELSEHNSIAVNSEGRIFSGRTNGTITVVTDAGDTWSMETLRGHEDTINCLQALPDGRLLSASQDGTLRIWTEQKDEEWASEVLKHGRGGIGLARALSPGVIVSGGGCLFWGRGPISMSRRDEHGDWCSEQVSIGAGYVSRFAVFPDGRIVTSEDSKDGSIRVWTRRDDKTWKSEELRGHAAYVKDIHVLPDDRIVSASFDHTLRVWTLGADGTWSGEVLSGHTDNVQLCRALPDGRIVSASDDCTLRVWTRGNYGRWSNEILKGNASPVRCIQALPDGRILTGEKDGTVRLWSTTKKWFGFGTTWTSEALCWHTEEVRIVQALPDGRIVSWAYDGTVLFWDGEIVDMEGWATTARKDRLP